MVIHEIEQKFGILTQLLPRFRSNRGSPPFQHLHFLRTEHFEDAYYDSCSHDVPRDQRRVWNPVTHRWIYEARRQTWCQFWTRPHFSVSHDTRGIPCGREVPRYARCDRLWALGWGGVAPGAWRAARSLGYWCVYAELCLVLHKKRNQRVNWRLTLRSSAIRAVYMVSWLCPNSPARRGCIIRGHLSKDSY